MSASSARFVRHAEAGVMPTLLWCLVALCALLLAPHAAIAGTWPAADQAPVLCQAARAGVHGGLTMPGKTELSGLRLLVRPGQPRAKALATMRARLVRRMGSVADDDDLAPHRAARGSASAVLAEKKQHVAAGRLAQAVQEALWGWQLGGDDRTAATERRQSG